MLAIERESTVNAVEGTSRPFVVIMVLILRRYVSSNFAGASVL
jgi:hypothetical protein